MPTKKISDLPHQPICRNPEHNPPSMRVFEPGVYEHTCPGCGHKMTFTVPARPTWQYELEVEVSHWVVIPCGLPVYFVRRSDV